MKIHTKSLNLYSNAKAPLLDLSQNGPFHIKLCLASAKSVAGFKTKFLSYCTLNPLLRSGFVANSHETLERLFKCKGTPLDLPQNGPFHIKLCLARAKSVAGFKTMVLSYCTLNPLLKFKNLW